jgi:hypothetical protein
MMLESNGTILIIGKEPSHSAAWNAGKYCTASRRRAGSSPTVTGTLGCSTIVASSARMTVFARTRQRRTSPVARAWLSDVEAGGDVARPRCHYHHAITKVDRFLHIMGYQQHGDRLGRPDALQLVLSKARQGVALSDRQCLVQGICPGDQKCAADTKAT